MEKRDLLLIIVGLFIVLTGTALLLKAQGVITGLSVISESTCPDDMVSYWKLDDTTGTSALDSLSTNDGTLTNGPAWTTGVVEGALSFDGVDDYVSVPDDSSLDMTDAITLAAWINPSEDIQTETTTYTFSGITRPSSSHKTYDGEIDVYDPTDAPPSYEDGTYATSITDRDLSSHNRHNFNEYSTTEYGKIAASDDIRDTVNDPGYGDNAILLHTFYINESVDLITQIDVKWEGYQDQNDDKLWLLIWNYEYGRYHVLEASKHTNEHEYTGTITLNPEHFVDASNNNEVTILAFNEDTSASIYCDYVELNITHLKAAGITKENSYAIGASATTAYANINSARLNTEIPPGWIHVALTYDKNENLNQQKLYINGELEAMGTLTESINSNSNDLHIGENFFKGMIDEVTLFNRSISSLEVRYLFDSTKHGYQDYCSIYHDHGTINVYYSENTDTLDVWGEAPENAVIAQLAVIDTDDESVEHTENVSVADLGDNGQSYNFSVDVSSFNDEAYNLLVTFFDSSDDELIGYDVSALFSELAPSGEGGGSEVDLDDVWDAIDDLNNSVSTLEGDVGNILDMINNNSADISELITLVNNINNNLTLVWVDVDDLWIVIDGMNISIHSLTTRMDNLESTVSELISWLEDVDERTEVMNHGTINLFYMDDDSFFLIDNQLRVWGEAPIGATEAHVALHDTTVSFWDILFGLNPEVEETVPVINNGNLNVYEATINTKHLDPIKYNVRVTFYDGPNEMVDYRVSALFDGLLLDKITDLLDDISEDLYGDDRNELLNVVREDYCDWKEARDETSGYEYTAYCPGSSFDKYRWRHLLDDYGYEDTLYWTMRNHYRDSADLWNELDAVWDDIAYINFSLFGLGRDEYIDEARDAWCVWKESTGDTGGDYNTFCTSPNKETNWAESAAKLGYDDILFTTATDLYQDNAEQWENIDDLWAMMDLVWNAIDELNERLFELEERVGDMDHGTINLFYYGEQASMFHDNTLYVWGEAPFEAKTAVVSLRNTAGDVIKWKEDSRLNSPSHLGNPSAYWVKFNTKNLDPVEYNVRVEFFDDSDDDMGSGYDVSALFNNMAIEDLLYGIYDVTFTSRVETYYEPEVTVPITYTLRTDHETWFLPAGIWITDEERDFYQLLRWTYVDSDTEYKFTDYVDFSELGEYNLKLEVRRGLILPWIFESTTFTTDVIELADLVPNSTLDIVRPNNWGNIHSTPPNPPNGDISWHQSGLIWMKAMLGENTPLTDTSCDVYYYTNKDYSTEESQLGRLYLSGLTIHEDELETLCHDDCGDEESGTVKYCADNILSTMMDEGDEGVFDLEVEQEFISSYDQMDTIRIGIDDTPPEIWEIIPEEGAYSGVLNVYVTAYDSLSGVDTVWVTLILKDNETMQYPLEATFNETSGYFEVGFDTIEMEIEDGSYNISVEVTDNVGLVTAGMIDPIVDNTPPEVRDVDVPSLMCVGDDVFTIDMTVVDLMSGVCGVEAELAMPNSTIIELNLTKKTGGLYSAEYLPETNLSGIYELRIDAWDCAILANHMEQNVTTHNLTINATCPPPPTTGGGGGGSVRSVEEAPAPEPEVTGGNPAMNYVGEPVARQAPEPEPVVEERAPEPVLQAPAQIEEPAPPAPEPKFPWLPIVIILAGLALLILGIWKWRKKK